MGKDKDKGGSPGGPEKPDAEALFRMFHSTYKASCEELGTSPLPLITKEIDEPEKLNWLLLNKERIKPAALQAIVAAIKVLDPDEFCVRHLTLWSCGLGDAAAGACAELLDNQHRLEVLDLFEEGVTPAGILSVAPMLGPNEFLKELQLSYNKLGDEGVLILTKALSENHALASLQLAFVECGQEGAQAIAEQVLANNECVLQKLSLRGNELMGVQGVRAILEATQESKTIVELDLSETMKMNHVMNHPEATETGLRNSLRDALAGHPTLTKVDLKGNHIDTEDATTLLALAQTNKTITNLQVDRDLGEVYNQLSAVMAENQAHAAKAKKGKSKKKK